MSIAEYQQLRVHLEARRDRPAQEFGFSQFAKAFCLAREKNHWEIEPARVMVVAGTNGKGTVCKTVETLLVAAGQTVGLFTSPHLISTLERIHSLQSDLDQAEFLRAFDKIAEFHQLLNLSHFETLTLMACEVFFGGEVRPRPDFVIFETGVGGLWDPTRAIPHELSVITKLGLDHQKLLGASILEIADHKLGITTPGGRLLHLPWPNAEVAEKASRLKNLERREAQIYPSRSERGRPPKTVLQTPWGEAPLKLLGQRAVENTSLALQTVQLLGFSPRALLPSLAEVHWPGRMEEFHPSQTAAPLYLSGDHNEQGAESLRQILGEFDYHAVHLLVAVADGRNADELLQSFAKIPRVRLYLTVTEFRRRELASYGDWLARAEMVDGDAVGLLQRMFARVLSDDLLVVSGSLFLVGEIRQWLLEERR